MINMESSILNLSLLTAAGDKFVVESKHYVIVSAVLGLLVYVVFSQRCDQIKIFRPNIGLKMWTKYIRSERRECFSSCLCGALVPLTIIFSCQTRATAGGETQYDVFQETLAWSQFIAGVVIVYKIFRATNGQTPQHGEKENTPQGEPQTHKGEPQLHLVAQSAVAVSFPVACSFIVGSTIFCSLGLVSALIQITAVFLQCLTQAHLPLWCPLSFTLGEACIIAQSLAFFLGTVVCNVLQKFEFIFPSAEEAISVRSTNFYMEMAVLCCLLVAAILFTLPRLRSILGFYAVFGVVMSLFALPSLYVLLGENFVRWTWVYVTSSKDKIFLFAYWAICCVVAAFFVSLNSCVSYLTSSPSSSASSSTIQSSHFPNSSKKCNKNVQYWPPNGLVTNELPTKQQSSHKTSTKGNCTRKRKLFHLLAVAIFVPGVMAEPVMMCVAGTCCLVVFIMMEIMRLLEVPPLGGVLQATFVLLLDEQDQGPVILTHMYLLVGCLCPLWLYPILAVDSHIAMYSGVISLGVGDTAAAVIGSTIGRHHWPGTHRTVEGTAAAIVSQILFIVGLQYIGAFVTAISWTKIFTAVILTSMTEAYTHHVDNLILPLVMYSLLM